MTKKRISDLLREEVNRDTETDTNTENSQSTTNANSESTSTTSRSKRKRPSAVNVEETVTESTLKATEEANLFPNQVQDLESLEAQKNLIKILQEQLQQATQKLEEQNTLIEQLNTELAQAQGLKSELEAQKTLINKLNTELAQAQGLKSELDEQKQLVEKLYAELQTAQPKTSSKIDKGLILTQKPTYDLHPRPDNRYIAPTASSTVLSNEQIGWFD